MIPIHSKPGTAYAVFKCTDPRPVPAQVERFKEALGNIMAVHEETMIPPETSFSVLTVPEAKVAFRGEGALVEHICRMEGEGAGLVIRSSLPGAPNVDAARDLGDVLNMLYGGTELFEAESGGRERLIADIFFEDKGGRYVSKIEFDASAR